MKLWIDIETRGPNFSQGLAKYALTAEVIMVQWAIDDGPITVEDLTIAFARRHGLLAQDRRTSRRNMGARSRLRPNDSRNYRLVAEGAA